MLVIFVSYSHLLFPCHHVLQYGACKTWYWYLQVPELVHFISELIHYTLARSSGGVAAHMPLIQLLVTQVMNLRKQLKDSSKVSFRVQYPITLQHFKRGPQEFKQTRYASILGGEVTPKILYMKLVEATHSCRSDETWDWRPSEASLYCILAMSSYVSVVEADIMPQAWSRTPEVSYNFCLS
ncbi:hypothetical protein MKX01_011023 [Papaver californicum]|nr:hypothetical protein MKX01_011023 [Papaver californicum]